ncbi:MAG: sulfotransferase, partial [Candidatus Hodarchaeota archaeon]
ANVHNPQFESFYRDHMKKLLINRKATRYVAKNNYNVARMEYLHKLFPDVKFIIIVRNPFDHIASLVKQDGVLKELEHNDPRLLDWTKLIGHREFGTAKVCINYNNPNVTQNIRNLWNRKKTYLEGWATYWAETYSYIQKMLDMNPNLAKASLIVRYEDLCEKSELTIDRIIEHIEVDPKKFNKIKDYYSKRLSKPTYYTTKFSNKEQEKIIQITGKIAEKFGYAF